MNQTSEPRYSNSKACLQQNVGKRIIGFLEGMLPLNDRTLARTTKTFVFDDGSGFTFNNRGAFWTESPDDVKRAIDRLRVQLEDAQRVHTELLDMAGAPRG